MFLLKNLIELVFTKPGSSWLLGNVTPGDAMLALMVPFTLGFCFAAFIMHKRP